MNPWLLAAIVFGGIALVTEASKTKPKAITNKPKENTPPQLPVEQVSESNPENDIVIDSESAADDGGIE